MSIVRKYQRSILTADIAANGSALDTVGDGTGSPEAPADWVAIPAGTGSVVVRLRHGGTNRTYAVGADGIASWVVPEQISKIISTDQASVMFGSGDPPIIISTPAILTNADLGDYGDGSDGVCDFDGSATVLGLVPSSGVYTLTRDIQLAGGSHVRTAAKIAQAGFALKCAGTLTTEASSVIHCNGKDAAAGAAGAASGAAGTSATGAAGGAGSTGVGVGTAGGANAYGLPGATGTGGAGGGDGTHAGGAGGAFTALAAAAGTARDKDAFLTDTVHGQGSSGTAAASAVFGGGSGGGGGAGDNADATGGGGGGGGGVCRVAALNLVHAGIISANGGAGAAGTSAAHNAGGGGGGRGGTVLVVTRTKSGAGTFTATGGAAGAKAGSSGVAGTAGAAGDVLSLVA